MTRQDEAIRMMILQYLAHQAGIMTGEKVHVQDDHLITPWGDLNIPPEQLQHYDAVVGHDVIEKIRRLKDEWKKS